MPTPTNRPIAALLACCVLLVACGGDDDPAKPVTIGGDRASGKRAKATAAGIVNRPASVAIRVSAAPKQRVSVSWGLSCPETDEGRDDSPTGGTYVVTPPNIRRLRLPDRTIAFCAVNAEMVLTRSGRAKVAVLGEEKRRSR